jgi:hypothetical protein
MMSVHDRKNTCGFAELMVSYAYDEADEQSRAIFESHLPECDPCADEFAGLSEARLSVYEWHRDEFVPLPTPHFVNPAIARVPASRSWLSSLSELLGWGWLVPAAALLLIGIGIFASLHLTTRDDELAAALPMKDAPHSIESMLAPTQGDGAETEVDEIATPRRDAQIAAPQAAVPSSRPRMKVGAASKTVRNDVRAARPTPAMRPVLANNIDVEDRSLRLLDLFDEGGR